jgi:hypothetical protein
MTDLSALDFEDVVVESYHLDYVSKLGSLFIDLQNIKHNLFLVEKILQLPFRMLFLDDPNMLLFSSFVNNALDINIMTINRLITNTGSMNLPRFRNGLLKEIKPEYQAAYRERLKKTGIEPSLNQFIGEMVWRRNEMVAHNEDTVIWAGDVSEHLLVNQKKLYAAMERAFQAAIFKESPVEAAFELTDVDIDWLLDIAAKKCKLVHMKEQDEKEWHNIRGTLDQSLIDRINRHRSELGLAPVA